ncbi:OLC1v1001839C1 [Oldenlandia corymbosa var. corymbosa]|uniref:OLC1v1001839C1 n=1 Tax=Oldenlandia corymbosa var. corymbosa TaxID=529605 RepID=A0AAV1D8Q6_OLDCO|nr:OLC1v1001839C1 [Oldenlandia corymbosa var. corymbosa]
MAYFKTAEPELNKEKRAMVLEEWLKAERRFGELGDVDAVLVKLPMLLRMTRQLGTSAHYEEYIEYLFPDDEPPSSILQSLEAAYHQKMLEIITLFNSLMPYYCLEGTQRRYSSTLGVEEEEGTRNSAEALDYFTTVELESKEKRAMVLEEWLNAERSFDESGAVDLLRFKLPKKLKRRKQIEIPDGTL